MKTIYGAVRRIALWKIVLAGSAALGTLLLTGAVSRAQTFMNYDGTTTSDYSAAVAAWANAAEFKKNWSLNAMNAQYAYTLGFSANGVKLGAVDSGIAVTHPEFVNRGVSAIAISGTYDSDGQQLDGSGRSWKKGDAFNAVPGTHIPAVNDDHGTLVSGHIMAANDGTNIMGVAFNSKYYLTNSNGNDGSIYGSNMDYNYFYAAYSSVALKDRGAGNDRVRVINTSWGSPVSGENYDTLDGVRNGYFSLFQADKPIEQRKLTWLDAAAKVAQEYDVLMVWANGNTGYKNGTPRAVLPYFRPELEKYWIAATGLNSDLTQTYNECGISKYWCVATPATYLFSAQADGSIKNVAGGGTSTAAPQVTGALGILMERYPYLGNEEVRTILLTTTKHLGDGPVDTPNVKFGWGIPDLQKAMNGPSQLLGTFNANIPAGTVDLWSNGISQAALVQRKSDDVTEAEQIRGEVRDLRSLIEGSGLRSQADAAPALIETLLTAIKARDKAAVVNAMNAISGNRVAVQILGASLISQITTRILNVIIRPTTSTANTLAAQFPSSASFTEESLAKAVAAVVVQLQSTISASEQRLTFLAKPDSAYVGSLIKSGDGALILTGKSTFTGSTTVEGGLLEVNGSLVSVVTATKTAQGSGTIGGTGTIGGLVAQSGGIVSPGNSGLTPTFNLDPTAMATIANPKSIGTLTLAGNATFEKGSGFLVQIAEDGRSDLLKVMGKTQLNGGLVYVAPETRVTLLTEKELEGPAFVGKTYTILTSGGGVSGTFDAALPAYKFVRADLGYTASDVQLSFSRNAVAFSAAADTANQKAVADAIEKFGDSKIERFVGPSGIPTATAAMTKDAADLAAAELAAAKAAAELAAAKAAAELAAAKAASELAAARAAAEQAAATAAAELAAAKAAADQATKAAADLAATKAVAEQAAATVAAELAAAKTTAEQALARAAADMAAAKTVAEQAAVKAAADLAAAKAAADLAVKAATDLAAAKTVAELAVVKAAAEQAAAKAAIELAAAKTAAEQAAAKAAAELVVAKAALDQAAKVAADLAAAKTAAEQAAAKAAAELVVAKAALDQAAKVAADLAAAKTAAEQAAAKAAAELAAAKAAADLAAAREAAAKEAAEKAIQAKRPLQYSMTLYNRILLAGANEDLNPIYDALSGDFHVSTKSALINDATAIRDAMFGRLRSAPDSIQAPAAPMAYAPPADAMMAFAALDKAVGELKAPTPLGLWAQGLGSTGRLNGDGNASALTQSSYGFLGGFDRSVAGERGRVGILAGYTHSTYGGTSGTSSNKGESDNLTLGLYGSTAFGPLALRGGASYTWHELSTKRQNIIGTTLTADYSAASAQVFAELGYRVQLGAVALEPFANAAYVNLTTGAFNENASNPAALIAPRSTTGVAFTTLGLRGDAQINVGGLPLTANAMLGWRNASGEITPLSTFSFEGAVPFQVQGAPIARNALVAEAGLAYYVTPSTRLNVTYGGQYGSGNTNQTVRGGVSVAF